MKRYCVVGAAMLMAATAPASAAEHVVNGGFETGDFTGFVATPGAGASLFGVDGAAPPHSGNFSAYFGSTGDPDRISQSIVTEANRSYVFSFFLKSDVQTAADDLFSASFNDMTLLSLSASPSFAYRQYTFTVTALSAASNIAFASRNANFFFDLDDVSVIDAAAPGIPEPATWALLVLGFGMIGSALRGKRRGAGLSAA